MNVTDIKDFIIKCKKCKSKSIELYITTRGGCPSCGPESQLEISCNNCHNMEAIES